MKFYRTHMSVDRRVTSRHGRLVVVVSWRPLGFQVALGASFDRLGNSIPYRQFVCIGFRYSEEQKAEARAVLEDLIARGEEIQRQLQAALKSPEHA